MQCYSDDEFLAKLFCLRQGFETLLKTPSNRDWLIQSGRNLLCSLIRVGERNVTEFEINFQRMLDYINVPTHWHQIEEELKKRKVAEMTFYDIVLDFMIVDAFDDLENPPSAIMSILKNRWLADSLKETAIAGAVWSVLKLKRKKLVYNDGFVSRMYDISYFITPTLAWGFLGPETKLQKVCNLFKSEVVDLLRSFFSFRMVRYTNAVDLSDDILQLMQDKFYNLSNFIDNVSPS